MHHQMTHLFPLDLPGEKWLQFQAQGYPNPVSGIIWRTANHPCCGMALGGIGTGCLDIDPRGVLGLSTLFNATSRSAHAYNTREIVYNIRDAPLYQPFLGLSSGGTTWVLSTRQFIDGGDIPFCTDAIFHCPESKKCPKIEDVRPVEEIHTWGHFPVVDMEYKTDAPVSVGMRAWSPFIPGNAAASNIPAIVFQTCLRNETDSSLTGTVAFSFPGPSEREAGASEFARIPVREDVQGILVASRGNVSYFLGVIGAGAARFGGGLSEDPRAWSRIATELPDVLVHELNGIRVYRDAGASAAVDFSLAPHEEKTIPFLLSWFAPVWEGASKLFHFDKWNPIAWQDSPATTNNQYFTHMYALRYGSALDVARQMAREHERLLKRIISWQSVIYDESSMPVWLRDSLINSLYLFAENSLWAQPKPPLGDWCFPGGLFGMNESPRCCPQVECIPCTWLGSQPVMFFFPELHLSTLRAFKRYQRADGAAPFGIGKIHDLPDLASPNYNWQQVLNGTCYVHLVDRLWQRTGDDRVLEEFYDSVKKSNSHTMELRQGPGGVISMPTGNVGSEWFEAGEWAGMCSHLGGLHLSQLRVVERMASRMGDTEYLERCRVWFADGSRAMEEDLWNGAYYLNFYEKETGKKSDEVMAYQLDGEWVCRFHGLAGVFDPARVPVALDTIKRCNVSLTPDRGAANFGRPDGSPLPAGSPITGYGSLGIMSAELLVLAMTYMYCGHMEFGLELARRHWEHIVVRLRRPWDPPALISGEHGENALGEDYQQSLMLWSVPAAIESKDIASFCAPGGFISRIIEAGIDSQARAERDSVADTDRLGVS